jgi:hypothetical protein
MATDCRRPDTLPFPCCTIHLTPAPHSNYQACHELTPLLNDLAVMCGPEHSPRRCVNRLGPANSTLLRPQAKVARLWQLVKTVTVRPGPPPESAHHA